MKPLEKVGKGSKATANLFFRSDSAANTVLGAFVPITLKQSSTTNRNPVLKGKAVIYLTCVTLFFFVVTAVREFLLGSLAMNSLET